MLLTSCSKEVVQKSDDLGVLSIRTNKVIEQIVTINYYTVEGTFTVTNQTYVDDIDICRPFNVYVSNINNVEVEYKLFLYNNVIATQYNNNFEYYRKTCQ